MCILASSIIYFIYSLMDSNHSYKTRAHPTRIVKIALPATRADVIDRNRRFLYLECGPPSYVLMLHHYAFECSTNYAPSTAYIERRCVTARERTTASESLSQLFDAARTTLFTRIEEVA